MRILVVEDDVQIATFIVEGPYPGRLRGRLWRQRGRGTPYGADHAI